MEGTTISLAKLWEDYQALAEVVHGLRGRVAMLEARVEYLERERANRTPYPLGSFLGAGMKGVYDGD